MSKLLFPQDKVSLVGRCHAGLPCYQADNPTTSRLHKIHLTNDILYDKFLFKFHNF